MDDLATKSLCTLPQRKPDRQAFDVRPKAVDKWLNNLPMANLGETSRQLHDALNEVNTLLMRPARRVEFLELVRGTVYYAVEGLRKHYLHKEFPLPPKNRRVAELSLTLLEALSHGYRIVVQEAVQGARVPTATLRLCLYRALRDTAAEAIEGYLIYEPNRPGLWLSLHRLYLIADQRGMARARVPDQQLHGGQRKSSIGDAYRQILLTAAAGPYRMPQGEALETYHTVQRWAPDSRLARPGDTGTADGVFRIRLHQDQPPLPMNAGDKLADTETRILITSGLVDTIEKELSGKSRWNPLRKRAAQDPDHELLRWLMMALAVVPRRRFSRVETRSQVSVVVGLSHIHKILDEAQSGKDGAATDTASQFTARDVEAGEGRGDDIWELVYPTELLRQVEMERRSQTAPVTGKRAEEPAEQDWRLVNISAGGYCLLSDPHQSSRAQVGELIAIRELKAGERLPWQVAVIRWMKHIPGAGMQLGVQVLAVKPQPVLTQAEQESGEFAQPSRCLILPEVVSIKQPVTLLTPPLQYAEARRVRLASRDQKTELLLTRRLENTGAFAQFEFRAAASGRAKVSGENSAFESVWSSI